MSAERDVAIAVKGLSKTFRLPTESASELKRVVVNFFRGVRGYKEQKVLKDISFTVEKGDFFGVVGRNGSGKSTLLKILSGIYEADKGKVEVNGSLVPFIELGVGFNPELTGRENVYLNGALLGFSVEEISAMYDDIVEFAELHEFMEQKLKNYSSGMQVRLAFSVAIRAKSDILILDEVLAVGDEAFQRKCNEYFEQIRRDRNQTVILVTHSMGSVQKYCNKAMMIRDGKIALLGAPEDVANEYSMENLNVATAGDGNGRRMAVEEFKIDLLSKNKISQNDKVKIKVSYKMAEDVRANALIVLTDVDRNVSIAGGRSKTVQCKKGEWVVQTVTFDLSQLNDSSVRVVGELWDEEGDILGYLPDGLAPRFLIRRTDYPKDRATWAVLFSRGEWE
ncbi:ABC transporter ATP-binding protein [Candidatus Saccharibacteria bacterium]|nr:ABC transporter ATP-binding protein [Candidatus Saccharibacteria bacterium]